MNKTYLFAGASSLMAIKTAELMQTQGHHIIGLSTKEKSYDYDTFFKVENYETINLPAITDNIDGLVYFPGTINLKPFHRLTTPEFRIDYETNSLGAVNCIQTYLPNLKKSTKASIVLISSVAVQMGMPFHASIAMSKGALEGLTKALAAELAPIIRVNAVAPSLTSTPLAERFTNTPDKLEASEKRNPLKKVGKAEEIAQSISFLLTDQSAWITGQILAVDGGMGTLKL
ncbi:MAG: SDR family oxidoreductase [Bacteroidetes bacterium]|nr:SDR family oxidoreductase [Bacteroidota bacterium]